MTQSALKKEANTQIEGQVSEALSSIRSVIKQNLEQGFEHFNMPQEGESTDENDGLEEQDQKTSQPAEVFFLTQVLEADGSITNLEKEDEGMTEETPEESPDKPQGEKEHEEKAPVVTQSDGEQETPAGGETPAGIDAPSSDKEASSDEAPEKEPSAGEKEPSAAGEEPSAAGEEPSAGEKEPSAAGEEPSAADPSEGSGGEAPKLLTEEEEIKGENTADAGPETPTTEAAQQEATTTNTPPPAFSEQEAVAAEMPKAPEAPVQNPVQGEPSMPVGAPAEDIEIGAGDPSSNDPTEDLASKETLAESAASFSELATIARQMSEKSGRGGGGGGGPSEPVTPERAGGYTVEELMRELLRPMLKDWLDTHLPSLVKWLVTEQIEKMLQGQGISTADPASAAAPASKPAEPAAPAAAAPEANEEAAAADPADMDFDTPAA